MAGLIRRQPHKTNFRYLISLGRKLIFLQWFISISVWFTGKTKQSCLSCTIFITARSWDCDFRGFALYFERYYSVHFFYVTVAQMGPSYGFFFPYRFSALETLTSYDLEMQKWASAWNSRESVSYTAELAIVRKFSFFFLFFSFFFFIHVHSGVDSFKLANWMDRVSCRGSPIHS